MQNTEPAAKTLSEPESRRRNWLEVAEYASIFGSAVGTLVAAVSQQFVLAAAPLTVAVSLNLINRSRLAQQQRQLPNIEPTNPEEITSSFEQFFPFSPTPELLESTTIIDQEIEQIKTSISQLQESTLTTIQELQAQISSEKLESSEHQPIDLITLQQIVSQLQTKIENFEENASQEEDWGHINVQLLFIKESIAELKNEMNQLQGTGVTVEPNYSDVKNDDSDLIAAQIHQLNQRIEQLEQKNREIVKPYLQQLVTEVKKLKKNSSLKN